MTHIYSMGRKHIAVTACTLALLTAVSIYLRSAVAEDAKQGAAGEKSKMPLPAKANAKASAETNSPEKLMVGTWRGGSRGGKFTLNADGTYREFPTSLSSATQPDTAAAENAQGTWSLTPHELEIVWQLDQQVPLANGEMHIVKTEIQRRYKIARLDGSFLRLIALDDAGNEMGAVFYRRLGDVTTLAHLKDKVSADVLRVAELAHMDSEEALLLEAWAKSDTRLSPWLAMLDRGISAARGRSGLKELFNFTDDELKATNDLKKLIGVGILSPDDLKAQGLLAPEEESAIAKISAARDQWGSFSIAMEVPPNSAGIDDGVRFTAGLHRENENFNDLAQSRLRSETLAKLKRLSDEFNIWLTNEAFMNPGLPPPGPAGAPAPDLGAAPVSAPPTIRANPPR